MLMILKTKTQGKKVYLFWMRKASLKSEKNYAVFS
jgi:hypothetical protein